jgi:apolipoprotein N-acyltransferase
VTRRRPGVIELGAQRRERGPIVTRARALKTAIAALSGTLLFLSCATFDIWPLTWIAVVPLLAVALHPSTTRPAYYGFICGLFANGGGFYWIVPFLQRFGHLPLIAAIPIFLLLISYQAITFTLFAWATRRLADRFATGVTFIAPAVYVAFELIVPSIFPWYLAITQAWVRPPIQIAELTGPLGVSFVLILSNAAIYDAWHAWRGGLPLPRRRLALAVAILAATVGYGLVRIHAVTAQRNAAPRIKIGVVQANIGIQEKWHPGLAQEQLALHQSLSRTLESRGAELIVWPESSYPYAFRRDQSHDWPDWQRRVQNGFTTPILFGTLTLGADSPYPFNTALLMDRDGDIRGTFDKNILMVFGEYIPFFDQLKFIKNWIPEVSNFARGTDVSVFTLKRDKGDVNLGPMICYEDIFPGFVRRLAIHNPNILINITNDAWFGRTSEPYEHLALAVYRSIETRLDMVRAVNTGVSTFVDATGKVYDKGPSVDPDETPGGAPPVTLLDEVAIMQPQKLYARLGEWFGGACLLVTLLLGLLARARGGRPVRWRLVLAGAGALFAGTMALAALFCGPRNLGLALLLIAHRPLGVPVGLAFSVGVRLIPAVALACLGAGVVVTRLARPPAGEPGPRLEAAMAVLAVLVAPAALVGTLEGEQAGLVIMALVAVLLTLAAARVARRWQ